MNNPRAPDAAFGDPQFEQAVRETAYFLWEHDGKPDGREQEYWYRALEKTLRQRQADGHLKESPPPRDDGRQIDDNQDDLGRDVNNPANRIGDRASATRL